ncbi:MAG: helix-turn-helix domain-containing protein [Verrucomicrobia bacterium]|nr:helix-turn-helix domain-containing protein [Verrucomicrobiota bacterium]
MPSSTNYKVHMSWGAVFDCLPAWNWEELVLEDMDIWGVRAGRGTVYTEDGPIDITEGDCLIMRAGHRYSATHDPSKRLSLVVGHFNYVKRDGSRISLDESKLPPIRRRMRDIRFLTNLVERAVYNFHGGHQDLADRWMEAALMEVAHQDEVSHRPVLDNPEAAMIESICARIDSDPGDKLRVASLADDAKLSGVKFVRLFRKHKGVTPREYITATRINAAKELLLASNLDVGQIASRLGYDNLHFFSRQFKEKAGVTPTAYRRGARSPMVGR